MSLILSGTNGLSDVDGSAATPAIRGTDTNTGIFFPAADTVGISTGGTERARVDSSGNLGLGVTPSAWATSFKAVQINTATALAGTSNRTFLGQNWYDAAAGSKYLATGYALRYDQVSGDGSHAWYNAPSGTAGNAITFTQAMTLDASGNLLVGGTAQVFGEKLLLRTASGDCYTTMSNGTGSVYVGWSSSGVGFMGTATNHAQTFYTNGSERARITSSGILLVGTTSAPTAVVGSTASLGYSTRSGTNGSFSGNNFNINWTGNANLWIDSTNLGTFQFSSDHRIKKNIATQVASGIDRVMLLRPVTYELADYGDLFKEDGVLREGFIAHEVQEVIPSGAEGEKDQEDRIQSLRLDAILSVAVKAIQEQQAIIQQLQADVAALKGTP